MQVRNQGRGDSHIKVTGVTVVLFRVKIRGLVSFREVKSEITTVSVMAVPFRELSQKI